MTAPYPAVALRLIQESRRRLALLALLAAALSLGLAAGRHPALFAGLFVVAMLAAFGLAHVASKGAELAADVMAMQSGWSSPEHDLLGRAEKVASTHKAHYMYTLVAVSLLTVGGLLYAVVFYEELPRSIDILALMSPFMLFLALADSSLMAKVLFTKSVRLFVRSLAGAELEGKPLRPSGVLDVLCATMRKNSPAAR